MNNLFGKRRIIVVLMTICILFAAATQTSARIGDGMELHDSVIDLNNFNSPVNSIPKSLPIPKSPPIPKNIFPGNLPQILQIKEKERNLINSIPDPAMEYNAIGFVEDLYKYQGYAMTAGSLLTGSIPIDIPQNQPLISFEMPFKLEPLSIDRPKFDGMGTGLNLVLNNIKKDIQIKKQQLTEPMIHNIEYKFKDYGMSAFGKINIKQQWTPDGDLGTLTRNINKWSTYNIKTPDSSYSRQQIPQIRPISQSSYRTTGYSSYSSYR